MNNSILKIYKKENLFSSDIGVQLKRHHMTKVEPNHLHDFVELVYVSDGSGVHGVDGVEYRVKRGALLFINYRQTHYFKPDEKMSFVNILLDPAWIEKSLLDRENAFELLTLSAFSAFQSVDTRNPLIRFGGAERSRVERLIGEIEEELQRQETGYETVLRAQINILLALIFRKMSVDSDAKATLTPEFLQYIRTHCAEKLSLEELSQGCFYTPSYFSRLFKEHYGITLTDFIRQSRMELAERLLMDTALSAEEIALQAGFGSKNALYKAFREKHGITPSQYRKKSHEMK
ncbi:MAG: helix-turn-helix domain-containing protein [Clostridia bacterium]|nr:helix-turn-helix domain-containing protein [Clostridia bacterium]